MDTMYRKKVGEKEKAAQKEQKKSHVADHYNPRIRPRETHPDTVSADKRISKNLNKLNRHLLETPSVEGEVAVSEDSGVKVVTSKAKAKVQAPVSFIFSVVILAAVFMYMLSLSVQVEEYSHAIDQLESGIVELKDEATKLEVQLESKYDLNEVERIATQEYGMVAASALPKKYISVTPREDVWQEPESEEEEGILAFLKDLFSSDEKE